MTDINVNGLAHRVDPLWPPAVRLKPTVCVLTFGRAFLLSVGALYS